MSTEAGRRRLHPASVEPRSSADHAYEDLVSRIARKARLSRL